MFVSLKHVNEERERERETDRQTETERDSDREEKQADMQRGRQTETCQTTRLTDDSFTLRKVSIELFLYFALSKESVTVGESARTKTLQSPCASVATQHGRLLVVNQSCPVCIRNPGQIG